MVSNGTNGVSVSYWSVTGRRDADQHEPWRADPHAVARGGAQDQQDLGRRARRVRGRGGLLLLGPLGRDHGGRHASLATRPSSRRRRSATSRRPPSRTSRPSSTSRSSSTPSRSSASGRASAIARVLLSPKQQRLGRSRRLAFHATEAHLVATTTTLLKSIRGHTNS